MSAVRPNALKARTLAGETVLGALVFEFFSPGMPQVLKAADCEFALFDMEHTGLGFETLKMLFAACRGVGISPMVRVPRSEYHFLARALDVGAHGVMVPMVESAGEAQRIVEATHYPPQGRRGAAFGIAQDDYRGGDVKAKVAALNERTLVIAQIESERGLDEVEAIAATPGIDVLWLDTSTSPTSSAFRANSSTRSISPRSRTSSLPRGVTARDSASWRPTRPGRNATAHSAST